MIEVTVRRLVNAHDQDWANPEAWEPKYAEDRMLINPLNWAFYEATGADFTTMINTGCPGDTYEIKESIDIIKRKINNEHGRHKTSMDNKQ